jgi:hypothetical protein
MTLPPPAPQRHDWTFTAASVADPAVALLIAVCRRCGLLRAQIVGPGREPRIDVTGTCDG